MLEALAAELLEELRSVSVRLENVSVSLPAETTSALRETAESAAALARRGLESDIEGAGLKARAIVDAVYRAQSRAAMWMWIGIGLAMGTGLFGIGFTLGRGWPQ